MRPLFAIPDGSPDVEDALKVFNHSAQVSVGYNSIAGLVIVVLGEFTGVFIGRLAQTVKTSCQKVIAPPCRVWLYPRSRTGGGLIFLPQAGRLWHIGADCIVNRRRMQVYYSGSVQGVGFRYSVKSVATGFEVAGTVRNLPDGRVELIAEGDKGELESFRQAIRDAGLEHFIRDEKIQWTDAGNEFRGFEIAR